jgi:hypothetical protein
MEGFYMNVRVFSPGDIVPSRASGTYGEVDLLVRHTGHNATCVDGERFPPTRYRGYGWILVRLSNP